MGTLEKRQLGTTGLVVSTLGIGGHLGIIDLNGVETSSEQAALLGLRRALELGINYFDTAPKYHGGESERLLGFALATLREAERDSLVVSTKVGYTGRFDAKTVLDSLDRSLSLLGRIDIVYIHDPQTYADMRQIFGKGGALEALQKLKAAQVIRAIGLGVRTHHFLQYGIEAGVDVILPSFDLSPLRWSAVSVIDYAMKSGVGVVNASPYVGGLLAGPDPETQARRYSYIAKCKSDIERAKALWQWTERRAVSIGALALKWGMINNVTTTLLGPRSASEIEQSIAHVHEVINPSVWQRFLTFATSLGPWEEGVEQSWR